MPRFYQTLAAMLVAAMLGTLAFLVMRGNLLDRPMACRETAVAGGSAAIGGDFTLVDQRGVTVTDKDVITGPSLVYFGYATCPDVCPVDSARNAEAVDLLEKRGVEVTPIFITVDPERDTPETLAEFVGYMHERMIGLTGTPEQIRAAAEAYKVYYARAGEGEDYLMDHTAYTYLMFPGTGFADLYHREATPKEIADSVACFVTASG